MYLGYIFLNSFIAERLAVSQSSFFSLIFTNNSISNLVASSSIGHRETTTFSEPAAIKAEASPLNGGLYFDRLAPVSQAESRTISDCKSKVRISDKVKNPSAFLSFGLSGVKTSPGLSKDQTHRSTNHGLQMKLQLR